MNLLHNETVGRSCELPLIISGILVVWTRASSYGSDNAICWICNPLAESVPGVHGILMHQSVLRAHSGIWKTKNAKHHHTWNSTSHLVEVDRGFNTPNCSKIIATSLLSDVYKILLMISKISFETNLLLESLHIIATLPPHYHEAPKRRVLQVLHCDRSGSGT